jgi:hypothetical protein
MGMETAGSSARRSQKPALMRPFFAFCAFEVWLGYATARAESCLKVFKK